MDKKNINVKIHKPKGVAVRVTIRIPKRIVAKKT